MAIHRTGQGSEEETQFEIPGLSPPAHAGAVGQLNGYELQSVIGHGAMGVVYRAWEGDLSRPVAIKFMAPQQAADTTARERFLREARSAAAVKHSHIVTIHKVGEHANIPYIVMEFVEGESLYELIHRERPLPATRILDLARQICQGLAAAHGAGIIHRDIKPSNVLVERATGQVKIVDFGLARPLASMDDLTLHGQMLGTPSFMSPEQARGQSVDARSDLFSLGCVLYAMIAGQSPFQGSTAIDSVRKVIDHPVPPLPLTPLPLPGEFVEIVTRLLSKSPADRFTSARDVLSALNQIAVGPVTDTATVVAAARPKTVPRFSPAAARIVAALILASAVIGGAWWQSKKNKTSSSIPLVSNNQSVSDNRSNDTSPVADNEITVARSGSPDHRDLEQALLVAQPGNRIRVLDDASYRVHLDLRDAARLRGVTVESTQRATLVSSREQVHLIELHGMQDVTFRGFKVTAPANASAFLLTDGAAGIMLEDLVIEHETDGKLAAIHVDGGPADARPNTIRKCEIRALGPAQCVWAEGHAAPVGPLVIEDNTLAGAETIIILWGRHADTRIQRNRFVGGANAINLNLPAGAPATADEKSRIALHNNTFLRSTYWIGLVDTIPNHVDANIRNNLLVDCDAIEVFEPQLSEAANLWTISNNLWSCTTDPAARPSVWNRWATFTEAIPLHSDQPDSPDFLTPRANSEAAKLGAGGDLPLYIGAHPPK